MSLNSGQTSYILAVFLSITGLALHIILSPHFALIPFILAMPIIFMISTILGFGPALVSIVIWSYGLSYFYFEPLNTFAINDSGELFHLIFFLVLSLAVSWTVERTKRKEFKLNIAEAENRIKASQLELENKLKDQFVNTLAHDLRNPLHIAMMSTEMISKKSSEVEKVKELATKAAHSLGRINRMILDLLDSRSISAGNPLNMDMAKFDLPEVLKKVVEDFSSMYEQHFHLIAPDHVEFNGCERYIQRAIENLVTNAIKYGAADKPIEIGMEIHDNEVAVWVRNWGKVLTKNEIDKILKPFGRLNPGDTSKEGWGIGLFLVKEIVEGHKGALDIISNDKDGTKFQMRLHA